MRVFKFIAIAFLTFSSLFYGAVGLYRLLVPSHLERELENSLFSLHKIQIFQCLLTSLAGFLMICTKHKAFKMFVSIDRMTSDAI